MSSRITLLCNILVIQLILISSCKATGISPIKVLGNANTLQKTPLGTSNQKSLFEPSLQTLTQSLDKTNVLSWRDSLHDSDSDTKNQYPSLNSRFTTSTPTSNKASGLRTSEIVTPLNVLSTNIQSQEDKSQDGKIKKLVRKFARFSMDDKIPITHSSKNVLVHSSSPTKLEIPSTVLSTADKATDSTFAENNIGLDTVVELDEGKWHTVVSKRQRQHKMQRDKNSIAFVPEVQQMPVIEKPVRTVKNIEVKAIPVVEEKIPTSISYPTMIPSQYTAPKLEIPPTVSSTVDKVIEATTIQDSTKPNTVDSDKGEWHLVVNRRQRQRDKRMQHEKNSISKVTEGQQILVIEEPVRTVENIEVKAIPIVEEKIPTSISYPTMIPSQYTAPKLEIPPTVPSIADKVTEVTTTQDNTELDTVDSDGGEWHLVVNRRQRQRDKRMQHEKNSISKVTEGQQEAVVEQVIENVETQVVPLNIDEDTMDYDLTSLFEEKATSNVMAVTDTTSTTSVRSTTTTSTRSTATMSTESTTTTSLTTNSNNSEEASILKQQKVEAQKTVDTVNSDSQVSSELKSDILANDNNSEEVEASKQQAIEMQKQAEKIAIQQQTEKQIVEQVTYTAMNSAALALDFIECSMQSRLQQLGFITALGAGDEDNIISKNIWVSGTMGIARYNGKPLLSRYIGRTRAAAIGADIELPNNSIIGGVYNYVLSNFKYNNRTDKIIARTHIISMYGQTNLSEKLVLQGFVSFALGNVYTKLPIQNQSDKVKLANTSYSSKLTVAYKSKIGNTVISPHIGVKYGGYNIAGYDRSFETQSLSVAAINNRRIFGLIGLEVDVPMSINDTTQIIPGLHMEAERFLHSKRHKLRMHITSGSNNREEILWLKKPALYNYRIGGTITIKHRSIEVMTVYDYLISNNQYSSHQGSLKFKILF